MRTFLVVALVLITFLSLMAWISMGTIRDSQTRAEISRMRQLYGAWYLYSQDWNGQMAPNLYAVRNRLSSDELLRPRSDPFANETGPYPADACAFREALVTPVRVGYCYWGTDKMAVDWDAVINDPKQVLLRDPFSATYNLTGDRFGFTSSGPQTEISMLGAIKQSR